MEGNKTKKKREKTDENSGHYVIASSRPPERRPLERRTLAPKTGEREKNDDNSDHYVIASSRPPKRRPLERRPLVPKNNSENSGSISLCQSTA